VRPHVLSTGLVLIVVHAAACDGRERVLRGREPSHAADPIIERAATPEERRGLERVRDEVDTEAREKLRALDAEIESLERENERIRATLPAAPP
jgi:hypothetical protein